MTFCSPQIALFSLPYLLALEATERAWLRCGTKMVMAVHQSGGPMPHYFFHLAFGTRTLLDEEGIELPDRSAARAEALAVIRELSEAPTGGNSRRRAGWFLQLADEQGQFFRTPIGHPALELATPPRPAEERPLNPASATSPARQGAFSAPTQVAELVRQLSTRTQHAAQLLEHSRRLQHQLSSLCAANKLIRARARELVAYARLVTVKSNDAGVLQMANALARPSPPHLVAPSRT
jgi:hypothetical protein